MSINKFNPRTITLIVFILITGAVRTYLSLDENMFGLSNFSPIGAMAIFGGAYFNKKWKALFFPLLTLFVSDVVLQFTVFSKPGNSILYGGWYYVYAAFILMVVVGRMIRKIRPGNILLATFAVVIIHWLITDLGVWYQSKTYSQDLWGYWNCLEMAIPFEARFLVGTLIYSGILFGLFEWLKHKYPVLSIKNQVARS
jgi:hypothetical protein